MMADLKYAFRSLGKRPGFSLIAIATLALGIGASTAIFSVLDAVLLRPLPYPSQERLVEVRELAPDGHGMAFAQPNFNDLAASNRSFEAVASYGAWQQAIAGGIEPIRTKACAASADFFRVLGVKPVMGRLFSPEAKETEVAVVSYSFWKRSLEGRTNLEGAALRFENHSFPVIGVLPPGTEFPQGTEVWFPSAIYPPNEYRTGHNFRVIGRLKEGVSFQQGDAEAAAIGRTLKAQYGTQMDAVSFGLLSFRERFVRDLRGILFVLSGAVGLLLAIACSNVANLLLVRAAARRKEVALRAVLGASRARLARQFIAETLLLTLIAGTLGALLAQWSVQLMVSLYHGELPRVGEIGLSANALFFTLGLSLMIALVLGLVPVLQTSRHALQSDLQDSGRGSSSSHTRARDLLIVAQVALTLVLLIGAGLLGRSFQRLLDVNPGFRAESAIAMTLSMPRSEEPAAQRALAQSYRRLLERFETLPGLTSVGGVSDLPMSGGGGNGTFMIHRGGKVPENLPELARQLDSLSPEERTRDADYRVASGGYFAAMGIPLLRGRSFQDGDGPDGPHVALVSQSFARRYFPNEEAIGQQIQFGGMDGDTHLLNIIGVVGDVRDNGLDRDERPTLYANYFQRPLMAADFSVVVRAQGDPASLTSAMRREARALNPEMPTKFQTLEQVVSSSFDNRRFSMIMLGVFAGAALLLAMVGLYGIMSYITSQRTTEIGIRMALGAQRPQVLRMILRQSLVLAGAGMLVGIFAAAAGTRLLQNQLYGINATDLLTYASVILLLGGATLLASLMPARRAMKLDPMIALRHD